MYQSANSSLDPKITHQLSELAFGAIPLATQEGITTKIHKLICQEQEMISVTTQFSYRVKPAQPSPQTQTHASNPANIETSCSPRKLSTPLCLLQSTPTERSCFEDESAHNSPAKGPKRLVRSSSFGRDSSSFRSYLQSGWKKNFALICLFPTRHTFTDIIPSEDSPGSSYNSPHTHPLVRKVSIEASSLPKENDSLLLEKVTKKNHELKTKENMNSEIGQLSLFHDEFFNYFDIFQFLTSHFILVKFRIRIIFAEIQKCIKQHVVKCTQQRRIPGLKFSELEQEGDLQATVKEFQRGIFNLILIPRLRYHVWTDLNFWGSDKTFQRQKSEISQVYLDAFKFLDSKNSNL